MQSLGNRLSDFPEHDQAINLAREILFSPDEIGFIDEVNFDEARARVRQWSGASDDVLSVESGEEYSRMVRASDSYAVFKVTLLEHCESTIVGICAALCQSHEILASSLMATNEVFSMQRARSLLINRSKWLLRYKQAFHALDTCCGPGRWQLLTERPQAVAGDAVAISKESKTDEELARIIRELSERAIKLLAAFFDIEQTPSMNGGRITREVVATDHCGLTVDECKDAFKELRDFKLYKGMPSSGSRITELGIQVEAFRRRKKFVSTEKP